LGELVNSVEAMMSTMATEKGLKFKVIRTGTSPQQIQTDSTRLRQCLINLINNAIKFTEDGHVYLNVSQLEEDDGKMLIRFDIEDTGIGIPSDKQETIFDSFSQADSSTNRKFGGTGLGLTITKQLAGLLGGELSVSSEVGKGSVFTLTIPTGINAKQQLPDRCGDADLQGIEANIEEVRFSGHVLVAEDSPTNQILIRLLLEKLGFDVTIVENGKIAVGKALAQQYDLILMDMQMPSMNGYEATGMLKEKGITTPIIALTANAMKGDEKKCIEAGCDDYLSKPLDRNKLTTKIHKLLQGIEITLP
jgi:CheY-like chemotaxis protein